MSLSGLVQLQSYQLYALPLILLCGLSNAIPLADYELERSDPKEYFTFPYFVPGPRIANGEDLVDDVNALASKEDQLQFLIKILPPKNQTEKILSKRQLDAINLLSLTKLDVVIEPLINRIDFSETSEEMPVVHALGRLGEKAVEPIVKKLVSRETSRRHIARLGAALIEIKGAEFPEFIQQVKRRKTISLSDEVFNQLLDQFASSQRIDDVRE